MDLALLFITPTIMITFLSFPLVTRFSGTYKLRVYVLVRTGIVHDAAVDFLLVSLPRSHAYCMTLCMHFG